MFWILPILAGLTWLGMLLAMLIGWIVTEHRYHYSSMDDNQTMAYISDIGASHKYKTVFIACSAAMCAVFDLSFLCDRWLRHRGLLVRNSSLAQKILGALAIAFAVAGTAGLVLLTIFDVAHHKRQHDGFLLLFLGGYIISAICICWEYQRLGIHHRDVRILRMSFWIKLFFVLIEVLLAIVFASLTWTHHATGGATVEWVIAFIFCFYVMSFVVDLWPAARLHSRQNRHSSGEKYGDGSNGIGADGNEMFDNGGSSNANTNNNNGPGYINPSLERTGAANKKPTYDDAYGTSAARATRLPRKNMSSLGVNGDGNNSSANINYSDYRGVSSPANRNSYLQANDSNANVSSARLSAAELPAASTSPGPYEPSRVYGDRAELPS